METDKIILRKSQIAIIQLRRAIQLFNSKDYISAITLAGAANEILGKIAVERQGYNTLDGDKRFWDGIAQVLGKDKPSKDKIKKINNRTKNVLKHHDGPADNLFDADFEFEAQLQIDSSIRNYWIAFDSPVKDRIIDRYVKWYWS